MHTTKATPLKYSEVQQVIRATLSALSRHELEGCLFGSAAMLTYGMEHRLPKDVDIIVFNSTPEQTDEDIKDLIVSADANFFLTDSRAEGATHRILWHKLESSVRPSRKIPSSKQSADTSTSPKRACKVDILIPGLLDIPHTPKSQLYLDPSSSFLSYADSSTGDSQILPVLSVPFPMLLMLKLRAWSDHSLPTANDRLHERIPYDEEDIEELLRISMTLGLQGVVRVGDDTKNDASDAWMLGGFKTWKEAKRTVGLYTRKWPRTRSGWSAAGFSF